MSTFAVTVEKIAELHPIPNSDNILRARLEGMGFDFVVRRGAFEVGDFAIYFPLDSVLPEWVLRQIGMWDETKNRGMLGGGSYNRVKTIRLRGQISQGLIIPVNTRFDFSDHFLVVDPQDPPKGLTELLEVYKWEPLPQGLSSRSFGRSKSRTTPTLVYKYDIEGAQNKQGKAMFDYMWDQNYIVSVTEKVEGSHFTLYMEESGKPIYCSRNLQLFEMAEDHAFLQASRRYNMETKIQAIFEQFNEQPITFRGEIIGPGIQGNIYGLDHYEVLLFDIEVNGAPLDVMEFHKLAWAWDLPVVPDISTSSMQTLFPDKNAVVFSHGDSFLPVDFGTSAKTLREGIVIKPLKEEWVNFGGRLFVKQRDPIYLEGHDS